MSSIIAFEPHNTTFARPVYIAMAYDQVAAAEPGYVAAFFMKVRTAWQYNTRAVEIRPRCLMHVIAADAANVHAEADTGRVSPLSHRNN